ncbi:SUF system Fe-S cluster assembly regulator [Nitrogeniibacter mangrovi]|uniref:SUF system Fe-S cluster assembly regulator n=1 Tax=Nitrogeniibacter mangrovi TaxID=2016596 RepID=A0A6C1AZJ7_9RHOO|nr:SUF system Fe-S cluster assembly regulator [Nitrogeniibacter mangrovi]QID16159.1 SUF system Fe-S cluster assembly regulator [Nitrogeniibacter mangrovi]
MLRLAKLTDYGMVMLTAMAREPRRHFATAALAAGAQVSHATAAKILKTLVRAGVLASMRGAHGGYALARPAEAISLAEVIEALEGPLGVTECAVRSGLCAQEASCAVRGNWLALDRVLRRTLEQTSLADMTRPPVLPVAPPPTTTGEHVT